jgi:hypothetical protein
MIRSHAILAGLVALIVVGSRTSATEPDQQWHCEKLTGITDYLQDGHMKTVSDGYNSGSSIRIDFASGDVEVYQDGETAQARKLDAPQAKLVARTSTSITWVETASGIAPGAGVHDRGCAFLFAPAPCHGRSLAGHLNIRGALRSAEMRSLRLSLRRLRAAFSFASQVPVAYRHGSVHRFPLAGHRRGMARQPDRVSRAVNRTTLCSLALFP